MRDVDIINRIDTILEEARALAASENLMLRVAGERIAVIVADVLCEIDTERAEVISLLPEMLREQPESH